MAVGAQRRTRCRHRRDAAACAVRWLDAPRAARGAGRYRRGAGGCGAAVSRRRRRHDRGVLRLADRRMEAGAAALDPAMRLHQRVRAVIALRLEQNRPHKEAIRRALALLALPGACAAGCGMHRAHGGCDLACGGRSFGGFQLVHQAGDPRRGVWRDAAVLAARFQRGRCGDAGASSTGDWPALGASDRRGGGSRRRWAGCGRPDAGRAIECTGASRLPVIASSHRPRPTRPPWIETSIVLPSRTHRSRATERSRWLGDQCRRPGLTVIAGMAKARSARQCQERTTLDLQPPRVHPIAL